MFTAFSRKQCIQDTTEWVTLLAANSEPKPQSIILREEPDNAAAARENLAAQREVLTEACERATQQLIAIRFALPAKLENRHLELATPSTQSAAAYIEICGQMSSSLLLPAVPNSDLPKTVGQILFSAAYAALKQPHKAATHCLPKQHYANANSPNLYALPAMESTAQTFEYINSRYATLPPQMKCSSA